MSLGDAPERRENALAPRSALPAREVESFAVVAVDFELLAELRRERLAAYDDVDLVVEAERAVVDVRRADAHPLLVDEQYLRVHHPGRVFEDLDTGFEQRAIAASSRA